MVRNMDRGEPIVLREVKMREGEALGSLEERMQWWNMN
jgi:hypothetical protein